ncbi:MAG: PilT/PilU family type 4a pilus ATPase [Elusimicrobia bacterium]|nr:PilT/PilU family type 4a pilus ATPase [Elusimicrobiota bacterium]
MAPLEFDLVTLLTDIVARGGSDLHLINSIPPLARICGQIGTLPYPPLTPEGIDQLIEPYLSELRKATFEKDRCVNFSCTVGSIGRFRFNLYRSTGIPGATIRALPVRTFPLSALGLPPIVGTLASRRQGIIFVTGPTGSGKSTTMAAMLEWVNQTGRPGKVITIEDPIETLFKPIKCVFVQREVYLDTPSFYAGTLDSLRQDPDVLAIGEMRDVESMRGALLAAETGHLVLTTLHTRDASKTAQRIVRAFPADEQDSVREQLANTLEAVISQELVPRADGKGLVPAVEVLLGTPAVRQLIRENKLEQINDAIQSGMQAGMISKDYSLKTLYRTKTISLEEAAQRMRNPEILKA